MASESGIVQTWADSGRALGIFEGEIQLTIANEPCPSGKEGERSLPFGRDLVRPVIGPR